MRLHLNIISSFCNTNFHIWDRKRGTWNPGTQKLKNKYFKHYLREILNNFPRDLLGLKHACLKKHQSFGERRIWIES